MAAPKGIEIGRLIDDAPLRGLQIWVIVLCGMVVFLDGYDIQTMSLAVPSLAAQWSLPASSFSFALSAALVGIALGAALVAPLGDRVGRRAIIIGAMVVVGAASVATGLSTSVGAVVLWRLITGVGLGASMPNATALTSEYVPARRRAALVTLMYCNIALGAFTAGFVAPPILEAFGWQGIFFVGGIFPLGLAALLAFTAPESVRFLVARKPGDPRIRKILGRLAPGVSAGDVYAAAHDRVKRQSVLEVLGPAYRSRTLLLWCTFGLNLFVLYLLISWLPTLLRSAGWAPAQALQGSVMIQAGGIIGGLFLSWCVDRGKTVVAMISAYGVTAIALGLFAVLPSSGWSWWLLLLVIGGGTSGGQFALNALAASFYPPVIRATGVGWAQAVGRVGAILSPLIGGWVVQQQFAPIHVLGMLVVPVGVCAASVMLLPKALKSAPAGS
jgi:AAHS family 4-hydroxybenzoate transporter-like MFS transporter